MYQIDSSGSVPTMPAPAEAATPGWWSDGNPATGESATIIDCDWFNALQAELLNLLAAAGITPSKTADSQVLEAIQALAQGPYTVRGLHGKNNAATPNTQFDFSADLAVFRNPSTGGVNSISSISVITNNVLTAGPAANGRDQTAVFPASSWVHFYFIYGAGTVTTISSLSAPPTGPTLSAGYTAWAYIGAVYYGSGSTLAQGNFRGSWFEYQSPVSVVTSGSSTSVTPVALTGVVPVNALLAELAIPNLSVTSTSGGAYSVTCQISVETVGVVMQIGLQGGGTASWIFGVAGTAKRVSNLSQGFNYQLIVATGSDPQVSVVCPGYSVPNGGE